MTAEMTAIAALVFTVVSGLLGLAFHAGQINEKVRRLEEETAYTRKWRHDVISPQVDRISKYLVKHVPNGTDEL